MVKLTTRHIILLKLIAEGNDTFAKLQQSFNALGVPAKYTLVSGGINNRNLQNGVNHLKREGYLVGRIRSNNYILTPQGLSAANTYKDTPYDKLPKTISVGGDIERY